MGTRNLVCVVLNNEYKIAQYGQWDGYWSGQGRTVVNFIKKMNKQKFIEQLKKTRFLTKKELQNTWLEFNVKPECNFVDIGVAEQHSQKYPALSRDTGAKILDLVYHGKAYELDNAIDFARDGLYCEYGYIINLDNDTLETYIGFGKEPIAETERFYSKTLIKYNIDCQYYPIRRCNTIPFEYCKYLKFKTK